MSKISPHFLRSEFACKCGCGFDTVDVGLISVAEIVRSFIGPYSPSSACRCKKYNKKVGGRQKSKHLVGKAIDIVTDNPKELFIFLDNMYPNSHGIGLYKTFVHIDNRDKKVRWKQKK